MRQSVLTVQRVQRLLVGCPGITPVRVQMSSPHYFEDSAYAFDSTYEFDVVLEPSLVRLAVFPEGGCHCDSTQYRLVIRDTSQPMT